MGLESGSKKRNLEAGRFGYEGLGKETWEGFYNESPFQREYNAAITLLVYFKKANNESLFNSALDNYVKKFENLGYNVSKARLIRDVENKVFGSNVERKTPKMEFNLPIEDSVITEIEPLEEKKDMSEIFKLVDETLKYIKEQAQKYNFTYDYMIESLETFKTKVSPILEKYPQRFDECYEKAKQICEIANHSIDNLPKLISSYVETQQKISSTINSMIESAREYSLGELESDFVSWLKNKYKNFLEMDQSKFSPDNVVFFNTTYTEYQNFVDQFILLDDLIEIIDKYDTEFKQSDFLSKMAEIKKELIIKIKSGETIDKNQYVEKINTLKQELFQKQILFPKVDLTATPARHEIASFSIKKNGDKLHVIYKLDNGSYYDAIAENKLSQQDVERLFELLNKKQYEFSSEYGIEIFAREIIESAEIYYKFSEYARLLEVVNEKLDPDILQLVNLSKELVTNKLQMAEDLAPAWWGNYCPKYPDFRYHGPNPRNIHGVDHKYDYLLINDPNKDQTIYKYNLIEYLTFPSGKKVFTTDDIIKSLYGKSYLKDREEYIEEQSNKQNLDKQSEIERQAYAMVEAMSNGTIDVDGNQLNNEIANINPKQMGFTVFQTLAFVSFAFSTIILIIAIIFMSFR